MSTQRVPSGCLVSFYEEETGEKLAAYVAVPALPFTGLRVVLPEGDGAGKSVHEVTGVQVFFFSEGSWQEKEGCPLYADATVRPCRGIHAGTAEDGRA